MHPMMHLIPMAALMQEAAPSSGHSAAQDTSGKVAYVAQSGGPPDTSSYMYAGYIVGLACYAGYIVLMVRRIARSKRQFDALSNTNSSGDSRR
jgi:hypothetical protein